MNEVTEAVAQVALGLQGCIYFNDLAEERDWGVADNAVAVVKMLQKQPDAVTYSVPANRVTTLREFLRQCFFELGIEIEFSGKGPHEKGVIIDVDDALVMELGLDVDTFRFGETVVRVNSPVN